MDYEKHSVVNLREPQSRQAPVPAPQSQAPERPVIPKKPGMTYSRPLVAGLAALILIPLTIGLVLHPPFGKSDVQEQSIENEEAQVTDVVARVGELIELPQGEVPTVATVTDPAKLKDQVFFQNAERGDQVLIYTKARKAYLYDPVRNKLREVAPITTQ